MRWIEQIGGTLHRAQAVRARSVPLGMAQALGAIGVLAVLGSYLGQSLAYPSAESMYAMAQVGVALLLAYVIEAVWLVNRAEYKKWHNNWLGFVCGTGLGGLIGIAGALTVAARQEGGHQSLLDDVGLWWSIFSIGLLGILVTLQPLLVDEENRKSL